MSAVLEAAADAQGRLAERRDRVAEIEAELPRITEEEGEARLAALMKDVRAQTTAVDSEAGKLARKKARLESELRTIQSEIPQLEEVVRRKQIAADAEVLREEGARVEALCKEQFALWKLGGEQLETLLATFRNLVAVTEVHDQLAHEVRLGNLLSSGASREEWREKARLPISPFPHDFGAFLQMLVNAALDPYGEGYREGGSKSDDDRLLPGLTPDLRGQDRRPEFLTGTPLITVRGLARGRVAS